MDMIQSLISDALFTLEPVARNWFIFLFSFGEGLPVIGSILPGGTVALLVGSLSQDGYINPWSAIHLIALGSFLGDMIGFLLGKYLTRVAWIRKMVESKKHEHKWDLFDKHAALIIIFGKLLPFVRSAPSLFAGARKMNIVRYMIYLLFGSYAWAIGGIFGGNVLARIFGEQAVLIILAAFLLLGAITFLFNRLRKIHGKKQH